MSFFLTAPEHRGYCARHSRYECKTCRAAQARSVDYGVFTWRADGCYPRSAAIVVYGSEKRASRYAEKHDGNLVVRTLEKVTNETVPA